MAAEKIFIFLRQRTDEETAFGFLAFPNVFSDVYLHFNTRIMPAAGCKTRKMGTALTDRRKYYNSPIGMQNC